MEWKNAERNQKTVDAVKEQISDQNYDAAKILLLIDISYSLATIADELFYMILEDKN